jgi:hypothetical protein
MSSRTCSSSASLISVSAPRATIRNHAKLALGAACLILVSVTAGGCVLGNDNDRPVLAVDPLWDVAPGKLFSGDDCRGAGVRFMTWEIQDDNGKTLEMSRRIEDCKPLDFIGLVPGVYHVLLAGYDRNEEKLWETTCPPFELGRFDVLYPCEVDQVSGGESDGGVPADAATPADAGEPDAS